MVAAGSANSQRPKQQRDTRPRNGLMVLMVLILLKELSCPPGFQTEPSLGHLTKKADALASA